MKDDKTAIYEGRPINIDDIPSQINSLIERSEINHDESSKYGEEAHKLDEFKKSLDD